MVVAFVPGVIELAEAGAEQLRPRLHLQLPSAFAAALTQLAAVEE